MLAIADMDGVVQASMSGLARCAVVSEDACHDAIEKFLGPDPDSRDGTTGERISKVPGGWLILNHANYRDKRTRAQILTAARVAKHRARNPKKVEAAAGEHIEVYLIRLGETEKYKIGFSKNAGARVAELQTASPDPLRLLRVVKGSKADEKALHAALHTFAVRGEWFEGEGVPAAFDSYCNNVTPNKARNDLSPSEAEAEAEAEKNKSAASASANPKVPRTRKPDPIWDAVVETFNLNPITKSDKTRIGKVVRDLKEKGATPDLIIAAAKRYQATWPSMAFTPEGLLKHWDTFAIPETQKRQDETFREQQSQEARQQRHADDAECVPCPPKVQ